MTACNVFIRPDSLYLLTDGAAFGADGELVARASKVWHLPLQRAAVVIRGTLAAAAIIADEFRFAPEATFDELADKLIPKVRNAKAKFLAQFEHVPAIAFGEPDVCLCGWSTKLGPQCWYAVTHDRAGLDPWEPYFMAYLMGPGGAEFDRRRDALGLDPMRPDFDPIRDGLQVMELQRQIAAQSAEGGEAWHMVGGFVELTKITRDGLETRILRTWPDRIGERVRPDAAALAA